MAHETNRQFFWTTISIAVSTRTCGYSNGKKSPVLWKWWHVVQGREMVDWKSSREAGGRARKDMFICENTIHIKGKIV